MDTATRRKANRNKDRDTVAVNAMADAIRTVLADATVSEYADGLAWYDVARRAIEDAASAKGISARCLAGAVAATSPGMPWGRNLLAALTVADHRNDPIDTWRFPTRNGRETMRALAILRGGHPSVLGSLKTRRFYRNLCGNLEAVTIDRWAIRAAGIDTDTVNPRQYRQASIAYTRIARELGIAPARLQAIVWIVIRRQSGLVD